MINAFAVMSYAFLVGGIIKSISINHYSLTADQALCISLFSGRQARRIRGIKRILLTKEFVRVKLRKAGLGESLPGAERSHGVTESGDPVEL